MRLMRYGRNSTSSLRGGGQGSSHQRHIDRGSEPASFHYEYSQGEEAHKGRRGLGFSAHDGVPGTNDDVGDVSERRQGIELVQEVDVVLVDRELAKVHHDGQDRHSLFQVLDR